MDTTSIQPAMTAKGWFLHATSDQERTLCGAKVDRVIQRDGRWSPDCRVCETKLGLRSRHQR